MYDHRDKQHDARDFIAEINTTKAYYLSPTVYTMSHRLKKKLTNLGVDTSSARANESFCLIGTPLPPLEKSKDTGEFVPLWKQEVRDEKGRRRLHGAFTGGFSAGYFNTVGSKEGWTPSTFVSSRSERAKQKVLRPEDFMDDEDLSELKERQGLVDTTEEMDFSGGQPSIDEAEYDSVASTLEASMLPPPKDSVGARILKKMGWRLGQGIGPRLTWHQRRQQDLQFSSAQASIPDDEEAKKHTYAPRDTPILSVDRKDNSHGLGYSPGMGLHEGLGVKASERSSGPKLAAGFGLGALNDAEEDDIDVYDGSLNQGRTRLAYDAADREDDARRSIGLGRQSKPTGIMSETRSTPLAHNFRNGTPVLSGFVLSDKPVAEDRWFPLPEIPKEWAPNPSRVWENDKENLQSQQGPPLSQPHAQWKAGKSADERGALLGETPLPGATRSVFEYLSQKDRERLQQVTSALSASALGSHAPPGPGQAPAPGKIVVARTEPRIAQAALGGYKPYATNPEKQTRYNAYLQSQAFPDSGAAAPAPLPGQSVDEFNLEMESYAKAALLFKPMSGAMAGRFTTAAVQDLGPKIQEGLHMPSSEPVSEESPTKEVEKKPEEDPKVHAARMGMFGPLTRVVKVWQPARLLCKRFGVKEPNPEPEPEPEPTGAAPEASSVTTNGAAPAEASYVPAESSGGQTSGRRDLANIGLGEDEDQGRDTLTYVRPAMDVFKAIFASDEEDSDDNDEDVDGGKDEDHEAEKPRAAAASAPPESDSGMALSMNPPEPIDVGAFKPTFIPRSEREGKSKKEKKGKGKGDKALVSFEAEDDGLDVSSAIREKMKDRPKKKKRKEKKADDDHAMWVEKPPPPLEVPFPGPPPASQPVPEHMDWNTPKGRKRAVDFM